MANQPNPGDFLAIPETCFSSSIPIRCQYLCLCVTELSMFLAGAVWKAAAAATGSGGGGGGLFLKCWWAYWKCVRQKRNAGRGVGVCVCACV